MKMKPMLLGIFVASVFWMPSPGISEETPETRAAYRRSTLEELVAKSHQERSSPGRSNHPYSQNHSSGSSLKKENLFALEPINTSTGDVIGA